jgi:hypothetical protein
MHFVQVSLINVILSFLYLTNALSAYWGVPSIVVGTKNQTKSFLFLWSLHSSGGRMKTDYIEL